MLFIGTAIAAYGAPAPVHAGNAGGTITVSANVISNCTLYTSLPVAFTYLPPNPPDADAASTINLECTRGITATIDLGQGQNYSAGRRMVNAGGNKFLDYELYRDTARTLVWGVGTGNNVAVSFAASGATQSIPVYGRVPGGQNGIGAAAYTDAVTITVNF